MVGTTLKQRREFSQETRKKLIDNHVEGKGYKSVSKQLHVVHIIQKFKVHRPAANLPGGVVGYSQIDFKGERHPLIV